MNDEILNKLITTLEVNNKKIIEEANERQTIEIKELIRKEVEAVSVRLHEEFSKKYNAIEEQYNTLKIKYERLERELKKNNIIIFGLTAPEGVKLIDFVLGRLNELLGLTLVANDINDIYSIGKQTNNKPIIVKLISFLKKQEILRNCKKLKGTNISIGIELTIEERQEQKILRQHLKAARKQNLSAYIKNKRLVVSGQEYTAQQLADNEQDSDDDQEDEERKEDAPQARNIESRDTRRVVSPLICPISQVGESSDTTGKETAEDILPTLTTNERKITHSTESTNKFRTRLNSNSNANKVK
nr:unnamed protein product [Callosobruchus analis]